MALGIAVGYITVSIILINLKYFEKAFFSKEKRLAQHLTGFSEMIGAF